MRKSSRIRVKQKGRVTTPAKLRSKLGTEEGACPEAEEAGAMVLRTAPALKGGKVVGEGEHRRVIRQLDRLRRDWR